MRRTDADPFTGRHLNPTAHRAAAGEHQRVDAVPLNDRELKVAVIRCRRNLLPHLVHYLDLTSAAAPVGGLSIGPSAAQRASL